MRKIKSKSTDFEYSDLPKNRTEVFFDVIKNNWRKLFALGLIVLIAFIPFLVIIFLRDNFLLGISISVSEGVYTKADAYKIFSIAHLIAAFASWLSLYFLALLLGGVIRIIRQLVWGDPVFFKDDLIIGCKQNFKFGAIVATFFGIMLVISKLMLFTNQNNIIQSIPMALYLALIAPPLFITYTQSTIYSGKFSRLFHNSILIYIKKAPHMLLFTFILISPIFLKYIENFLILKYILLILIIYFALVYLVLLHYLFSNYLFDLYINPTHYPELIRKGMSKLDN